VGVCERVCVCSHEEGITSSQNSPLKRLGSGSALTNNLGVEIYENFLNCCTCLDLFFGTELGRKNVFLSLQYICVCMCKCVHIYICVCVHHSASGLDVVVPDLKFHLLCLKEN